MLSLRAPRTAAAYSADLRAWQAWCALLEVHPLAAERWHVDAWRVHLTTVPRPRTGTPASAATVARQLSAVAGLYKYGIGIGVLEHPPVESVQRPRVPDESQAVGLTTDELKRLLAVAAKHSAKSLALVSVLMFCGCRISEALAVNVSDFTYDHGHRVLRIMRKGNKPGRVVLTPPVVRALDGESIAVDPKPARALRHSATVGGEKATHGRQHGPAAHGEVSRWQGDRACRRGCGSRRRAERGPHVWSGQPR